MACIDCKPVELASDSVHKIPAQIKLSSNITFSKKKQMSADMIKGEICKADVFIDNIITVGVDKGDNLQRTVAGSCTIMHAVAHNAPSDDFFTKTKID